MFCFIYIYGLRSAQPQHKSDFRQGCNLRSGPILAVLKQSLLVVALILGLSFRFSLSAGITFTQLGDL